MEIKYMITEDDYIKFNLYHLENSPSQRRTIILLRFVLPFILAVFSYFIGIGLFKQPSLLWIFFGILYFVYSIISYPKKHKKNLTKQIKKMLSEGDNSSFFCEKIMSFDDNAIEIIDKFSSEIIIRNNIKTVKIYDDLIVIYLSSITAHIIPTRYLNNEKRKYLMDYFAL